MLTYLHVNLYTAKKGNKEQLLEFFDKQKQEFAKPYLAELEAQKKDLEKEKKKHKAERNARHYQVLKQRKLAVPVLAVPVLNAVPDTLPEFESVTEEEVESMDVI